MKKILDYIKDNAELVVKAIVYLLTLVNTVLIALGLDFTIALSDEVYQAASAVLLIVVFVYGVWDNFSVTEEAKTADKLLDSLKQGSVKAEEAKVIIDQLSAITETEESEE